MRFSKIKQRLWGGTLWSNKKQANAIYKQSSGHDFSRLQLQYYREMYRNGGIRTIKSDLGRKYQLALHIKMLDMIRQNKNFENIRFIDTSELSNMDLYTLNIEIYDIYICDRLCNVQKQEHVDNTIVPLGFKKAPYQKGETRITTGDVVVDVGAGWGIFSTFCIRMGADRCYAFEPATTSIDVIKENIELNDLSEKITVISKGLSDHNCEIPIYSADNYSAGNSVLNDNSTKKEIIGTIECQRLDDFININNIDKIDFIKIDTVGYERNVLLGAKETLQRFHPKITISNYYEQEGVTRIKELIKSIDPNYIFDMNGMIIYAYWEASTT